MFQSSPHGGKDHLVSAVHTGASDPLGPNSMTELQPTALKSRYDSCTSLHVCVGRPGGEKSREQPPLGAQGSE